LEDGQFVAAAGLKDNRCLDTGDPGSIRELVAPPPLPQKLPIAPIFIADSVLLAVSREKDGKLRIVYAGWDNVNVVQPNGYGQSRGGWEADLTPSLGEALTPPKN
jgi:hypothetical protein